VRRESSGEVNGFDAQRSDIIPKPPTEGVRGFLSRPRAFEKGAMNEVTRILSAIEAGDPQAAAQLLPLVYDELRKLAVRHMANEAPGQTLDATGLVHEA
jgi:hypothetical protein